MNPTPCQVDNHLGNATTRAAIKQVEESRLGHLPDWCKCGEYLVGVPHECVAGLAEESGGVNQPEFCQYLYGDQTKCAFNREYHEKYPTGHLFVAPTQAASEPQHTLSGNCYHRSGEAVFCEEHGIRKGNCLTCLPCPACSDTGQAASEPLEAQCPVCQREYSREAWPKSACGKGYCPLVVAEVQERTGQTASESEFTTAQLSDIEDEHRYGSWSAEQEDGTYGERQPKAVSKRRRCKRCGSPLPKLVGSEFLNAEAEDYCSDRCYTAHDDGVVLEPIQSPHPKQSQDKTAFYVASRASVPERGQMWRKFREDGYKITSSWIDEDGEGATVSFAELWARIQREIASSDYLVLYAEESDFPLKGALIEVGMALAMGKPVTVCLPGVKVESRSKRPIGSWIGHTLVERCDDILLTLRQLTSQPRTEAAIKQPHFPKYSFREGESEVAFAIFPTDHDNGILCADCASTPHGREFPLYADDLEAMRNQESSIDCDACSKEIAAIKQAEESGIGRCTHCGSSDLAFSPLPGNWRVCNTCHREFPLKEDAQEPVKQAQDASPKSSSEPPSPLSPEFQRWADGLPLRKQIQESERVNQLDELARRQASAHNAYYHTEACRTSSHLIGEGCLCPCHTVEQPSREQKHTRTGNCFLDDPSFEASCAEHQQRRGSCTICPTCPACKWDAGEQKQEGAALVDKFYAKDGILFVMLVTEDTGTTPDGLKLYIDRRDAEREAGIYTGPIIPEKAGFGPLHPRSLVSLEADEDGASPNTSTEQEQEGPKLIDQRFIMQLEVVADHCADTGLRSGAATVREAIRLLKAAQSPAEQEQVSAKPRAYAGDNRPDESLSPQECLDRGTARAAVERANALYVVKRALESGWLDSDNGYIARTQDSYITNALKTVRTVCAAQSPQAPDLTDAEFWADDRWDDLLAAQTVDKVLVFDILRANTDPEIVSNDAISGVLAWARKRMQTAIATVLRQVAPQSPQALTTFKDFLDWLSHEDHADHDRREQLRRCWYAAQQAQALTVASTRGCAVDPEAGEIDVEPEVPTGEGQETKAELLNCPFCRQLPDTVEVPGMAYHRATGCALSGQFFSLIKWNRRRSSVPQRSELERLVLAESECDDPLDALDGDWLSYNRLLEVVGRAWPEPQGYAQDPLELVARIIDERDEALGRLKIKTIDPASLSAEKCAEILNSVHYREAEWKADVSTIFTNVEKRFRQYLRVADAQIITAWFLASGKVEVKL